MVAQVAAQASTLMVVIQAEQEILHQQIHHKEIVVAIQQIQVRHTVQAVAVVTVMQDKTVQQTKVVPVVQVHHYLTQVHQSDIQVAVAEEFMQTQAMVQVQMAAVLPALTVMQLP